MYMCTYVFVSFETTPVVRIQILIDPTFNNYMRVFYHYDVIGYSAREG